MRRLADNKGYQMAQVLGVPDDIRNKFYGEACPEEHICYYGEIVAAYMIEE